MVFILCSSDGWTHGTPYCDSGYVLLKGGWGGGGGGGGGATKTDALYVIVVKSE